jgi:multicomponent Na+:H+ antiporter subunit A
MIWLLALHGVVAMGAAWIGRRRGRRPAFALAALAPLGTLAWVAPKVSQILDGVPVTERIEWVPSLGLTLDLRLDAFSLLMVGLISGIGLLICAYSVWYFKPAPGLGRLASLLTSFAGAMLGVVLADNLLIVYLFWELTSVTSYLLIGTDDRRSAARAAALQAILVTGAGGLAMLAGFILLGQAAGTYSLSGILASPPSGGMVPVGLMLVLAGALTKSAQAPFHSWLPGAMAAPTPISAYLHSATMVKAGIYLMARFGPVFADGGSPWRTTVVTLGVITMLLGGWHALRQRDLKLLLAHGTVSQLGFMTVLVGSGTPELTAAGVAVILAHGLFKAALFMVVGIVDHQAHTREIGRLHRAGSALPTVMWIAILSAASMAGLVPLFGFIAKESAYAALLDHGVGSFALIGVVIGSVLTLAYGLRFVLGAFGPAERLPHRQTIDPEDPQLPIDPATIKPASIWFIAPAVLLAGLTLLFGLWPQAVDKLVTAATLSLSPGAHPEHLAIWHGFNTALALSAVTIALGVLVFLSRRAIERVPSTRFRAQNAYQRSVSLLVAIADRTTAIIQSGSLPVYMTIILSTALLGPGLTLLFRTRLPETVAVADSTLQLVVAVSTAIAAITAALARRRFGAILSLGGVGYGVAVLFVLHGAPDLALTQLLVETLGLIVFVLVLRHLPSFFRRGPWRAINSLRVIMAGTVGVFVASFALIAATARTADPISQAYLDQALPDGGGRNVVNVILVDFRGLDTLGEISVLFIAALGIVGLIRAGRREREEADS